MKLAEMELKIVQTNDDGLFGDCYKNDFEYVYNGVTYRVKIEQCIKRELLIWAEKKVECSELFAMEALIEKLLFIFDGRFYPVESTAMIDEKGDSSIYQCEVNQYFNNRIPIYDSFSMCKYPFMRLVKYNYNGMDLANTLVAWKCISDELNIVFNMLLYCLSSIQMPVDCKISSIIEMVKPFGEILEKHNNDFKIMRTKKDRIELRTALETVIKAYGVEIFDRELNDDFKSFLDLLVNTRNKIAHISSRQNKRCLSGSQCAFYIAKISIMYRKIIYALIGVDKEIYSENIIYAVKELDKWYYGK